jgi:hypothetical protein
VALSFKSAPAQYAVSTALAIMSARTDPSDGCAWISSIWRLREVRSPRDIALRAAGRLRDIILILPQFGAGIEFTRSSEDEEGVEYRRMTGRLKLKVLFAFSRTGNSLVVAVKSFVSLFRLF